MNHKETIEYYERKKQQQAEASADFFFGVLADGILPFIADGRITQELGGEIMQSIVSAFQKTPIPNAKQALRP